MPLDIGVGILLALGVAEYFSVEATPFFIVFGVAAVLLPDVDIITIPLFGKWHHRTHTHFPLTYIPLIALAFVFLLAPYAVLFALAVLAHFIHDTLGLGFGIRWLWPFSQRRFLFLVPQDTGEHWVQQYYLRPNLIAYIEYGTLLVSLLTLFLYFA